MKPLDKIFILYVRNQCLALSMALFSTLTMYSVILGLILFYSRALRPREYIQVPEDYKSNTP